MTGCTGAQTCCPTFGCVDETSDPKHCGSCTNVCAIGDYCCGGNCTQPDNNNCTGCGKQCLVGTFCCFCPGSTMAPKCILDTQACGCAVGGGGAG